MAGTLLEGLSRYLGNEELSRLAAPRIGFAGCGGIGSNAALMLARSGVRRFLLVDHDTVDASNLNRQQFMPRDVGRPKAEALRDRLLELDPELDVDARVKKLTEQNADRYVPLADIWVEAFDAPECKRFLVERVMMAGKRVVSASGLGGWGGPPMRRRELGLLTLVGDFTTDVADHAPFAPRVTEAAALMADTVFGWILGKMAD